MVRPVDRVLKGCRLGWQLVWHPWFPWSDPWIGY